MPVVRVERRIQSTRMRRPHKSASSTEQRANERELLDISLCVRDRAGRRAPPQTSIYMLAVIARDRE